MSGLHVKKKTKTKHNHKIGTTRNVQDALELLTIEKGGLNKTAQLTHILNECSQEEAKEVYQFVVGLLDKYGKKVGENGGNTLMKFNYAFLKKEEQTARTNAIGYLTEIQTILYRRIR